MGEEVVSREIKICELHKNENIHVKTGGIQLKLYWERNLYH